MQARGAGTTGSRTRRALGAGVSAVLGLCLAPAALAAPAHAAPPPGVTGTPECPEAYPAADLTAGQVLTGRTVSRGTAPEDFTATVIGVLRDGIGPGVDMVLVDVDAPAVTRAGGIWSGMSGSPLYADDGRLVGAVSYGLAAGPSPIAGVTPAAAMQALLAAPAARSAVGAVRLPQAVQQRVVASGGATRGQAAGGLRALPVPLAVSGVSSARLAAQPDRLAERVPGARPYLAGTSGATATGGAETVVPGGNVAFALSNGQFSAAAVGTVTAVCGAEVLGFGHPFGWSGATTQAMRSAEALYVQPDSLGAPFKVANLGPVVGTGTQDRLAGVRGTLGPLPATVPLRTSLRPSEGGPVRTGTTEVVSPSFLPTAAFYHVVGALDATADRLGGGVVETTTTVRGHRPDGRSWTLRRSDLHASTEGSAGEAPVETAFGVASSLEQLIGNEFERVTVDEVSVEGTTSEEYRDLTVVGVKVRAASGRWVAAGDGPVRLVAGTRAQVQVLLRPYRSTATVTVPLSVVVPAGSAGSAGEMWVGGGDAGYGFAGSLLVDDLGYWAGDEPEGPEGFDEVLAAVQDAPSGDSVVAELALLPDVECDDEECYVDDEDEVEPVLTSGTARTGAVTWGGRSIDVEVVAPRAARAAVVSGGLWSLRSGLASGPSTVVALGRASDRPLLGDWDGDGTRTPGLFRDGAWHLRDAVGGRQRAAFGFGGAGDVPVVGDWDGDGADEVGVYRSGTWLLRDEASAGPATVRLAWGDGSMRPVVGDWDGDGRDEPGLFHDGTWRLRSDASPTGTTTRVRYGARGDAPVAGDWDRDGADGVGVVRAGTWHLRGSGGRTLRFAYGRPGARPLVG
ncbi:VCBS repeat-containing protein [Vallicoccus soli]|uniref:Peptidase S55 domain-containing protein n=1 Tax=Vallicoccus soli TaxID=2339232 RepID=A0A3A3Z5S3_9ACTN|nr:VCBS repeat-containing protein [Vallicoccus soli]RJK95964.1 hypothetical protein D5H78_10265 [Vallicoccus soli]